MSQPALKTTEELLADGHTPMMAQYHAVKAQYPDCLLFYRMGDFYEMFFDDALKASAALDITLTKRGKNQGDEIPMCGVPFHSYEPYLARLIRAGYKVAICEQTETPEESKKRGAKLVSRDVIRVITQGTLTEDSLLQARESNYLAALAEVAGQYGLAWLEISTGDFFVQPVAESSVPAALERIGASELLTADRLFQRLSLPSSGTTLQPASLFDPANAQKRLEDLFGVGTLESFGAFSRAEISAAGALIDYVARTQKGKMPRLARLRQLTLGAAMEIDAATRRNLELTRTLTGERKGSLLDVIDRTVTGPGSRLLQSRLSAPLTDLAEISRRHDEIESLLNSAALRDGFREHFRELPDMERALGRLALGRGSPRDLGALRDGLRAAETIRAILLQNGDGPLSAFAEGLKQTPVLQSYADTLRAALDSDLPFLERDGGFIAKGYNPRLDELRGMRDDSKRTIAALQARYKDMTGIDSLKISYNNILGYYIDVPAKRADALMVRHGDDRADNPFVHRQTLANNVRFTTPELSELERDLSSAADKALAVEMELFAGFVQQAAAQADTIGSIARTLAALDVAAALAALAAEQNYARPVLDQSLDFKIEGGRHPVVESALRGTGQPFMANDCDLSRGQYLWLLTGPNMAGKSTFLRQNALIAIMAQMGSYVPAASARIGVIDRLFSRVGAADDLARGRSTFMVEMVETAAILNQATEKSLVILDEIGRGTATFDGLSIAWACVEHLHEISKARALFATHYHELTALTARLPSLSCHSLEVKEWKGDVVFLHHVKDGAADRSYGIHVARLAGLPPAVIERAGQVLETLQKGEHSAHLTKLVDDLPLFTTLQGRAAPAAKSAVEEELLKVDPDALSPKEALEWLYRLKSLSQN